MNDILNKETKLVSTKDYTEKWMFEFVTSYYCEIF